MPSFEIEESSMHNLQNVSSESIRSCMVDLNSVGYTVIQNLVDSDLIARISCELFPFFARQVYGMKRF